MAVGIKEVVLAIQKSGWQEKGWPMTENYKLCSLGIFFEVTKEPKGHFKFV